MAYPFQQQYPYQRINQLRIIPVSNIMEANATPVESYDPIFFYNKAENVIYKKQIDSTGAAPIVVYKLEQIKQPEVQKEPDYIKEIRTGIEELKSLLKPAETVKKEKASKE